MWYFCLLWWPNNHQESCHSWIVTVFPGLCHVFPFMMFTKESLVFLGSIELQYIPRHHSYIIPRELETSGKVLFYPKSFSDSEVWSFLRWFWLFPPSSPWVITGSCFQISPLWAPPCSLPSSGAPTRSPSRATETPRQPREDDCRCPARRCWST